MPTGSTTPRATIALNVIVKDNPAGLEQAIKSAIPVGFDEVVVVDTGSTDSTPEVARRLSDTYRRYTNYEPVTYEHEGETRECLSDFAGAREYARILSKSDYIFYLDSDDVVWNPEGLSEYLEDTIRNGEYDGLYLHYDYEHDNYGNCILRHTTVRCAWRLGHQWKSPIHEVLCDLFHPHKKVVPPEVCRIVHMTRGRQGISKAARNAAVAKFWIDKLPDNEIEPRLWLNYGKSLVTLERYSEAIQCLERYIDGSGWNEERYFALLFVGNAYARKELYENALEALFRAVRLFPDKREAYLDLARVSFSAGETDSALRYLDIADTAESDLGSYQSNPFNENTGVDQLRALVQFESGNFKEAYTAATSVVKSFPFDDTMRTIRVRSQALLRRQELIESYRKVEFMVASERDPEKLDILHRSLPRSIEDEPEFSPRIEVSNTATRLAIFCGEGPETWGHDSHLRGGIGGSETAVIHMSRELTRLGYAVEVYGWPNIEQTGTFDGVLWQPYWRFNSVPRPEIFISWRAPSLLSQVTSPLRYCWLHDVQVKNQWQPEYWNAANAVFFLSKFHRQTALWIPKEKVAYSANGLPSEWMVDGENDPNRVIYASGPDRGLDLLLDLWPEVRERHPEAHLDVYYGFSPLFRKAMQSNEKYRRIYESVVRGIEQPGVTWHGRVDQQVLAPAFARSGVWAYPTSFPEISCITAMQAQATGAIPVTTGYAALSETVRYGKVVGNINSTPEEQPDLARRWLEAVCDMIGNERKQSKIRKEMVPWARTYYTWERVAKEWHERFQTDLKKKTSWIQQPARAIGQ